MDQVNLVKKVYSKPQYVKVIDTEFNQLVQPTASAASEVTVDQFFDYYNQLFFDIPKFGDTNSHEYLVRTSAEYIEYNPYSIEMQALIEELTLLRQTNLELQLQVANTGNQAPIIIEQPVELQQPELPPVPPPAPELPSGPTPEDIRRIRRDYRQELLRKLNNVTNERERQFIYNIISSNIP